jgi:hypothetical protein
MYGKLGLVIGDSIEGGDKGVLEEVWPSPRFAISAFILSFLALSSCMVSMAKLDWH